MKTHNAFKIFIFIALYFVAWTAQAQYSNQGFSFQGYAIDGNSKAIASTGITVRFTVYRTGVNYIEEHTLTTDSYGVFVTNVGKGTASSTITFGELDFNNFDFSLKVEVRETVGGTFVTISDKALQSVPYARAASNGVPVGTVVAFAGPSSNIPTGWLLCDGTTLNASTNKQYAQLFTAIGTAWGGTGISSFKVPDMRGQFLRGLNGSRSDVWADSWGTGRLLGSNQWHNTAQPDGAPFTGTTSNPGDHFHNMPTNPATGSADIGNFARGTDTPPGSSGSLTYQTALGGAHSHTVTINGGGNLETHPKNVAVNYIIKY